MEGFYTVEELANKMSLSTMRIRQMLKLGYIQPERLGKVLAIPEGELSKFEKQGKRWIYIGARPLNEKREA